MTRYRVAVATVVEVDGASPTEAALWAQLALGLANSRSHHYYDDLARTVPYTSARTGDDVVVNAVAVNTETITVYEVPDGRAIEYGREAEQWSDE